MKVLDGLSSEGALTSVKVGGLTDLNIVESSTTVLEGKERGSGGMLYSE